MKKYYCVTSAFNDRGNVSAAVTDCVNAESKPESTYSATQRADIYNDWFDNYRDAQKFVKDTLNA